MNFKEKIGHFSNSDYRAYIQSINDLDGLDKLSVYMRYYITQLILKHASNIKDIVIYSFDEFISDNMLEFRDCGEKWNESGYAQRHWIQPYGIYEWYSK